jgi:hypothetical protein
MAKGVKQFIKCKSRLLNATHREVQEAIMTLLWVRGKADNKPLQQLLDECKNDGEGAREMSPPEAHKSESCSYELKGGDLKMKEQTQAKIEDYLELLKEIKEKVGDEATAARILSEIARDARMEEIKKERAKTNDAPATPRQIAYLKRLNVPVTERLTKRQASALIDAELAQNGDGGDEGEDSLSSNHYSREDSDPYVRRVEERRVPVRAVL